MTHNTHCKYLLAGLQVFCRTNIFDIGTRVGAHVIEEMCEYIIEREREREREREGERGVAFISAISSAAFTRT